MVQVTAHLGVAELQAGYRGSKEATLARHFQVIWLLAQGHMVAETARLTGFVRRWVEELVVRYNRFGPASLGDRRRGNGAKPRILTPEILAMLRERVKTPPDDGGVWTAKKVAAVIAAALGLAHVAEQRGWEALRASFCSTGQHHESMDLSGNSRGDDDDVRISGDANVGRGRYRKSPNLPVDRMWNGGKALLSGVCHSHRDSERMGPHLQIL